MSAGPTAQSSFSIQSLESRVLLATVLVADYGARPDDGVDDSYQIQHAINSSAPGDTILFSPGSYNIGKVLDPLGGGRILKGQNTTLVAGANNFIFHFRGSGLTVTGFRFDGPGIFLDHPQGKRIENLIVDNNTFALETRGDKHNSIEFTTGLRNSRITNNYFNPIHGDNGIYGYYWDNLTIANNTFENGNEGIHLTDFGDVSRNLLIEQNYFAGLHRMGIELQGGGWDTIVQDNYYEKPSMTSNFNDNRETFAYSIIADSHNTIVRRNTSIAPERPDGVGVRIVFEIGGDNTIVEENYSVGGNHVLAMNDGVGSASVIVRNNLWMGYLQGPSMTFPAPNRTMQLINNGPHVKLSWDINRGKPGPNRRFESVAPPQQDNPPSDDSTTPTPPPTDQNTTPDLPSAPPPPPQNDQPTAPAPDASDIIDGGQDDTGGQDTFEPADDPRTPASLLRPRQLVAQAISSNRIDLSWQDNAIGETGYQIERSFDGQTWSLIAVIARDSTRYSSLNLSPNTKVYYRVRCISPAGKSAYSNVAWATTLPASDTQTKSPTNSSEPRIIGGIVL